MSVIRNSTSTTRRRLLQRAAGGLAGILAMRGAPAFSQSAPKKLVMAHIVAPPESSAVAFAEMAEAINKRADGGFEIEFHAGTLLTKEIEVINAIKAGNIAIGDPGGAAATVFPEMGVFLVPYLVKSYDQAYKLFNGPIGDRLDRQFQEKYKLKVLCFYDYGFRHFWNNRRPIGTPKDLRGLKLRVQPAKVFADTINGLGGVAVPMAWGEVIPAAQQGVIDGADLPIVNILALKAYEVSKILLDDLSQLRPDSAGDEPRNVQWSDAGAAEAAARGVAVGARENPRADRERRYAREGQGAARTQGNDCQYSGRRGVPQTGAREGLARLPERIFRHLGRDRRDQGVR
jgi:TRAP-type C4-dicarboxylate transport system substrate-binding protein